MKRGLIIGSVVVVVGLAAVFVLLSRLRSQSPEALLARLAEGRGDREDLIMQINLARGDVVGPMLEALEDKEAPPSFRADVLELLFKKHFRSPEDRIKEALLRALEDPDTQVRRWAAYGFAVYMDDGERVVLVECLDDPDPAVRRQAYMVLAPRLPERDTVWESLSAEQKEKMIETCLEQAKKEEAPEMRQLARAVISREIESRGGEATEALLKADVAGAEKILQGALALDPDNRLGQVRLIRFYLQAGKKEEALKLARQHGALFEIPELPEAPVIDGDPTDAVWSEAFTTEEFFMTTSRWVARHPKGRSRAHIGHRDGKIYIALLGYEDDMTKLARVHTDRDGEIYMDDCAEIVFDPEITGQDFYQFVVNLNGALLDIFSRDRSKNFKCEYKAQIFEGRGYWAVEFALDGKDLDNHVIEAGEMWALNVFRVRIGPASEHGGIWPLYGGTLYMHNYPLAVFQ